MELFIHQPLIDRTDSCFISILKNWRHFWPTHLDDVNFLDNLLLVELCDLLELLDLLLQHVVLGYEKVGIR